MKIYISGQITGQPLEQAKARFAKAAEIIKSAGHEPINPFEHGLADEAAWEKHMVKDIELLFGCDAICKLAGWRNSKGARIEAHIASEMDMKVCGIVPIGANEFKLWID